MSSNFFKIHKGVTLEPQTGADPSPARDGDIYYNDTLGKFRKHENGSWTDLGGSSSSNSRSGNVSLGSGISQTTVVFSSPLPTSNYVVIAEMENSVDANPQFQTVTITNKTTSGFTAKWNSNTDSVNYSLSYIVPGALTAIAEAAVPNSATTLTVTLNIPFNSSLYAVVASLQNVVDGSVQYQPVVITNKTPTSFTAKWNAPTDSANYVISYQATGYV